MSITEHPTYRALKERQRIEADALEEAYQAEFNEFADKVDDYFDTQALLLLQKHRDYGPTNISRSPGGPLNGLRVRIHDKVARINHLIDSGKEPDNESLRDSFMDLANYAVIALMVIDDNWPKDSKRFDPHAPIGAPR